MATIHKPAPRIYTPEILDLRDVSPGMLAPLLREETAAWRDTLRWDFGKSAELVRRFVDMRALSGCALVSGGQAIGYGYYVAEGHKALVGDVYLMRGFRSAEYENRLLDTMLKEMTAAPYIKRVESQLIMLEGQAFDASAYACYLTSFERDFMLLDCANAPRLQPSPVRSRIFVESWADHFQDAAGALIAEAYAGHDDSKINDQYRTAAGARQFLYNIVQYPGCGVFFRPASFAAFETATGKLAAICLASTVAEQAGHITQICTAPWARGLGLGYDLLRRSLTAMQRAGCATVSLTVTSSNRNAIELYESVGFRTVRRFRAFVWEGF